MYAAAFESSPAKAKGPVAHAMRFLFISIVTSTLALMALTLAHPASAGELSLPPLAGGVQVFGSLGFRVEYHFGNGGPAQSQEGQESQGIRDLASYSRTPGREVGTPNSSDAPGPDTSGPPPGRLESGFGISQDLSIGILAPVGERAQVTVGFKSSGVWGVQFPSDGSYGMTPTFAPPIIDEAYAHYSGRAGDLTAGRIRFSLGPVGLLVNNVAFPLEGAVATWRRGDVTLTGVYSRLSTQYRYGTRQISSSDDLIAVRVSGTMGPVEVGYNYLYSGLVDETGHSIDLRGRLLGHEIMGEVAYFRPSTTFGPEFNFGWVPGVLIGMNLLDSPRDRVYVSYGWLSKGFTPTFSSSASSSGGSLLGLYENTHGVEARFSHLYSGGGVLDVSITRLGFVDPANARARKVADKIPLTSFGATFRKPLGTALMGNISFERRVTETAAWGNLAAGVTFNF